jgi:putative hemolysin
LAEFIVIFVLIVSAGLLAGAEIAIVSLRRPRVEELFEEGQRGARALTTLREQPERFLATVQVGITIVGVTAAAFGGAALAEKLAIWLARLEWLSAYVHVVALALVVGGVSFLSVVIGELVPKSLALRSAERYALVVAGPVLALSWLVRPIVWVLKACANLLLRPFGDTTTFVETRHSAEELQHIMGEAARAGSIHPGAGEIALRALELPDLRVADVMIPRHEVIMLPHDATIAQVARLIRDHGHSRMPVYQGRMDNVVGYVSMKDLLPRVLDNEQVTVSDIVRPAFFVPESKRAVSLLEEMRQRRQPFAVVVEEQGGLSGVITIDDLVEELVGDTFSEHTRRVPKSILDEEGGTALVNGGTPIREVNRALDLDLPEDADYATIAGLALSLAGKMPSVGDILELPKGVTLEMVDVSPRRIRTIRVRH